MFVLTIILSPSTVKNPPLLAMKTIPCGTGADAVADIWAYFLAYSSLIRSFGAQKEILKAEIDRLTKLKKVAENAEKRIKEHLCNTMGMFGIDKIEGETSKITRAKTQAMETDDAMLTFSYDSSLADLNAALPPYITAEFKVSKTALKQYIKDTGITPNGAHIVENWSLRIR